MRTWPHGHCVLTVTDGAHRVEADIPRRPHMLTVLLVIIILLLLFGGGFGLSRRRKRV